MTWPRMLQRHGLAALGASSSLQRYALLLSQWPSLGASVVAGGRCYGSGTTTSSSSSSSSSSSALSAALSSSPPRPHPVTERYQELVTSGTLAEDAAQLAVVGRLAALYDAVQLYRQHMAEYHASHEGYQVLKRARLLELQQEDAASDASSPAAAAAGSVSGSDGPAPVASSGGGWLSALWPTAGDSEGSAGGAPAAARQLSAAQQVKVRAAAHEATVTRELGPLPVPPAVPQGLYLYGSVGSGKSLVMDLFFEVLARPNSSGVPAGPQRRLHFNAAMLEVHSRLHKLAQRRIVDLDSADARRAAAFAEQTRIHNSTAGQASSASALAQPLNANTAHDDDGVAAAAAAEAQERVEAAAAAEAEHLLASVADVPAARTGFLRYWDSGVQRQKEAKLAFLAVRRLLRLARTGGTKTDALAIANAANLVEVASTFIFGGSEGAAAAAAGDGTLHARHVAAVLCFDELQVTDVWTAAALKGLLEVLRRQGCVIVVTSNRAPDQLQRQGLHEDMFGHFITSLTDACEVVELTSQHDYRRLLLQGKVGNTAAVASSLARGTAALQPRQTYLTPLGADADAQLRDIWQQLTRAGQAAPPPDQPSAVDIEVMFGRSLSVPRSLSGVAWFNFEELCARPLGAADYMALAANFHTVIVSGIPGMSMQVRDQARRFITLVDELYNARCALVISAAVPPDRLFEGADGEAPILDLEQLQYEGAVEGARLRRDVNASGGVAPVGTPDTVAAVTATLGGADEKFAFSRAVSRLCEMQSAAYLSRCRQPLQH